jgi:hypothetical protein
MIIELSNSRTKASFSPGQWANLVGGIGSIESNQTYLGGNVVTANIISGIAGIISCLALWVSYQSYRKANSIKQLDMRLELKNKHSDLGSEIEVAKETIRDAQGSRKNIDAATGRLSSGGHKIWLEESKSDFQKVENIFNAYPIKGINIGKASHNVLEEHLHKVHKQSKVINDIKYKYLTSLKEDRKSSEIHVQRKYDQINMKS